MNASRAASRLSSMLNGWAVPEVSPLNAEETAIWHALKHLSDRALGAVGRAIETETGLSGADYGILTRLEDLGAGELRQHELAKSLGWDKARLSHQLTRMEARSLLLRDVQTPGKGVMVRILLAGRDAIAAARPVHASAVRQHLLRHLQPQEAKLIVDIVKRLD